ncbi:MAG: hypothetical protein AAFR04_13670 [Pseudomonadota bacterium]
MNLRILILGFAFTAFISTTFAHAAQLQQCGGYRTDVTSLVDLRSFANGNIKLVHYDTGGEPVCCSSHLAIVHPAPGSDAGVKCTLLTGPASAPGFTDVELKRVKGRYVAGKGLRLSIPVQVYTGSSSVRRWHTLTINQKTGTVTLNK